MISYNPTLVGEENETPFIRVWKPADAFLKTLRGNPKGKIQRGQYLLAMCLGGYINNNTYHDQRVHR